MTEASRAQEFGENYFENWEYSELFYLYDVVEQILSRFVIWYKGK